MISDKEVCPNSVANTVETPSAIPTGQFSMSKIASDPNNKAMVMVYYSALKSCNALILGIRIMQVF